MKLIQNHTAHSLKERIRLETAEKQTLSEDLQAGRGATALIKANTIAHLFTYPNSSLFGDASRRRASSHPPRL